MIATLQWHPTLPPLLTGALLLGTALWLRWAYRRLLGAYPRAKARLLMAPRVVIALLLMLALFEPSWRREYREATGGRILALLDVSASMDVAAPGQATRLARARQALDRLDAALPRDLRLDILEFDTVLHDAPQAERTPATLRETDIGACLLAVAERTDLASCLEVVLVTDGGDEPAPCAKLPAVPLSAIGVGDDAVAWNDLAVAEIQAPATAEANLDFEITAELRAAAAQPAFAQALGQVAVTLERASNGVWAALESRAADLRQGRAQLVFRLRETAPGPYRYRVAMAAVAGELSPLNNARAFGVDVRHKAIHVLYFARELGQDFKPLRHELARDPGLAFTALYRTTGERFAVQGDRRAGDDTLQAGFPADLRTLKAFDCLILGSTPAADWRAEQAEALTRYVDEGGALIVLGAEHLFGPHGYAATPLAPLFPWRIEAGAPAPLLGPFAISLPVTATGHPLMTGLDRLLAEERRADLDSVFNPGPLKAGALPLLNAAAGERTLAAIALQPYGKGKVLGIASGTFWKWARRSPSLQAAYALFWRQAIRHLGGGADSSRWLSVRWDKDAYRPGEAATAEIRIGETTERRGVQWSASLTLDGQTTPLQVTPATTSAGAQTVALLFRRRGVYTFHLTAQAGDEVLDRYEKTLPVGPPCEEGAHLELKADFLRQLTRQAGGLYVNETDVAPLARHIAARHGQTRRVVEHSPLRAGPWFALLVIALLTAEWFIRRRMNLI